MHWGRGIIIGMGLFMSFIIYMVITLMSHNVELQSEDYYKKEIGFESEIRAQQQAKGLEKQLKITRDGDYLHIGLPESIDIRHSSVEFMRPNDRHADQVMQADTQKQLVYPLEKLKKGLYNIDIRFEDRHAHYLIKTTFFY